MLGRLKTRAGIDPRDDTRARGADIDRTPAARLQGLAVAVIVVSALVAFAAVLGFAPLRGGGAGLALWLHPLVVALGAGWGVVAARRVRELDAERWHIVDDDTLTSGERTYAHKEAEQEMRAAVTRLLVAAIAVGAAFAYQLRIPRTITAADLLVATPVLGFGLGMAIGLWRFPKPAPRI